MKGQEEVVLQGTHTQRTHGELYKESLQIGRREPISEPAGKEQANKSADVNFFLSSKLLPMPQIGQTQWKPEISNLLMQSILASILGHKEGREGNWMGKWKISNTFHFKRDQMANGKEIGFIKIAVIYLGNISKRNITIAP